MITIILEIYFSIILILLLGMIYFFYSSSEFGLNRYIKKLNIKNEKKWQKEQILFEKKYETLLEKNKKLLLANQINLDKIRFINHPTFNYNIDNNVINPNYIILLPTKDGNYFKYDNENKISPILFDNTRQPIEINKPKNLLTISVNNYVVENNYDFIKEKISNTNRGIVIMLADEIVLDITRKKIPYKFSVESKPIRLIDLDEELKKIL
jgi:hypothetical protein